MRSRKEPASKSRPEGSALSADTYAELLFPLILVTLAVVGAILASVVVWRRMRRLSQERGPAALFTLHDLRRMRDAGLITEQEFDRMRAAIIGEFRVSSGAKSADSKNQGRP